MTAESNYNTDVSLVIFKTLRNVACIVEVICFWNLDSLEKKIWVTELLTLIKIRLSEHFSY